jgi:site-specific recombinase XerD
MAEKIAAANDGRYQQKACRTLPIPASVTPVAGYPAKLKVYLTNASCYWQVRCFFRGRVHTQSLRTTNKREALAAAKQYYEHLVGTFYAQQTALQPDAAPEQQFETLAERVILLERDRVARGELAEMTYRNTAYRLRQYWLPLLRNKRIEAITHYDIVQAIGALSRRGISSISLIQYLQSLRLIFKFAYAEQIITQIPTFPKIRKASTPRGGFTVDEYRLLVTTARQLACVTELRKPATHRNRAGGIFTKTESVPRELSWLIGFMVNGFMRPSDIIHIQHQHVEIVRGEHLYLRLTLPETKRHSTPIVTLRPAVRIYEKLRNYMHTQGQAAPDDYLFLPAVRNRAAAGPILSQHFNKVLSEVGLRAGVTGQSRTLYSLRHTAIMFRLLYGRGIDLLTLARNARTSVQMIEKFYASQLTAEMNIDLLQSRR